MQNITTDNYNSNKNLYGHAHLEFHKINFSSSFVHIINDQSDQSSRCMLIAHWWSRGEECLGHNNIHVYAN